MKIDCVDFYLLTVGELELPEQEPLDLREFFERKEGDYEYEIF